MPDLELHPSNLDESIAILLVIALFLESLRAWIGLIRARLIGQPWFAWSDEPRTTWTRFPELMALAVAVLMLIQHLVPLFEPVTPAVREPMSLLRLGTYLTVSGGLPLLLLAMLCSSQRPPRVFGVHFQSLLVQIRDGWDGYLLALLPTALLMVITAPLRTEDKQNVLLTFLAGTHDPLTVVAICLAAVVFAPLYEEMIFRVILQGWLTAHIRPYFALPMIAIAFAAIHGIADGIALLPLAGILGYVFYRRHSYLSVLVIHGLFNATMLALLLLTKD